MRNSAQGYLSCVRDEAKYLPFVRDNSKLEISFTHPQNKIPTKIFLLFFQANMHNTLSRVSYKNKTNYTIINLLSKKKKKKKKLIKRK